MSGIPDDPFKPKEITVSCMRCDKDVKVNVPYDYEGRPPRKWCSACKHSIDRTESYFDSNYSDGCRRIGKHN